MDQLSRVGKKHDHPRLQLPNMVECATFLDRAAQLLLGAACPLCGVAALGCCPGCTSRLRECAPHRLRRPALTVPAWAANPYEPDMASLILRYKEDGGWHLAGVLAERLAEAVAVTRPAPGSVLVAVPSRPAAVRRRGLDHAHKLARLAAKRLGLRALRLLQRDAAKQGQRGLDRAARQQLRTCRFRASPCSSPVVLVDDVVTTGTSLAIAEESLRRSGVGVQAAAVIADVNLVDSW